MRVSDKTREMASQLLDWCASSCPRQSSIRETTDEMGASQAARRLAWKVWDYTTDISWKKGRSPMCDWRADYAEAAQLLREGWTP